MFNLNKKIYLKILFFLSIIVLITAYVIEYVFGYTPCNLCIIERIPYIISIIILIFYYIKKKNLTFCSLLLILTFGFSLIISLYHLGIEQGLIDETSICVSKNINLITKEDILKSLLNYTVSCKDVAFRILNLSLTTYNIFISILMFLISIKIYRITNDTKK